MSKFFKVDSCDECPYHEQMWLGEYQTTERTYFCAFSEIQFLVPNEGKHEIHEDCEAKELIPFPLDFDTIMRAYA